MLGARSLEEIGWTEFDKPWLPLALLGHAVDEAEGPEGESFLQRVSIQLFLAQRQLDLLLGLEGQLAVGRDGDLHAGPGLCSDCLLDLFVAFGVEHDANGPGSLPVHAALLGCADLAVGLRVEH